MGESISLWRAGLKYGKGLVGNYCISFNPFCNTWFKKCNHYFVFIVSKTKHLSRAAIRAASAYVVCPLGPTLVQLDVLQWNHSQSEGSQPQTSFCYICLKREFLPCCFNAGWRFCRLSSTSLISGLCFGLLDLMNLTVFLWKVPSEVASLLGYIIFFTCDYIPNTW